MRARWVLVDVDRSARLQPADSQEPRAWLHYRRRGSRPVKGMGRRVARRDPSTASRMPAIEIRRRRMGVDPHGHAAGDPTLVAGVLHTVLQDVDDSASHLTGRAQIARVIAIRNHAAAPSGQAIQGAGHAHAKSLHRTAEGDPVLRLDDEMDVIGLDREMDEAHTEAFARRAHRPSHGRVAARPAQVARPAHDPGRHMDRESRLEPGTTCMAHLGAGLLWLAPSTAARSSPGGGQPQLELARSWRACPASTTNLLGHISMSDPPASR
jgi:hypothetical protein